MSEDLREIRCIECNSLICKENIEVGEVQIKCYRCNFLNILNHESKILESIFTAALS